MVRNRHSVCPSHQPKNWLRVSPIALTPYDIVCTHGWRGVVQTQQPEIVLPQGDVLEGGVVQVTKDSARDLQLGSIDIDVFVPQRQEVCSGQDPFRVVIQERDIE